MSIDCPACGRETVLHAILPEVSDAPVADLESGLSGSFSGHIQPAKTSFFYQFGLLLAALTMLVLPVVYVALICVSGWAVYWFAHHFWGILGSARYGIWIYYMKLMFYFGTLFIGVVSVLFMLKPLFAGRLKGAEPLAMNPAVERSLYAFIAKISELTGAPMPTRIDLDCQLNASVRLRRGLFSFPGSDMVLTIGLPLVGGFNTRELAGVIAHEMGHFTQGFALRLSYIIGVIDRWFLRVVYERDEWDVWLVSLSEDAENTWVLLIVSATQVAVWGSRRILQVLMLIGHAVSCFLSRQMEYSADRYQIQLAGSAAFESTLIHLHVLGAAATAAYKNMRTAWNTTHQLPDDFSACLLEHERNLPAQIKNKIEDTIGFGKTGLFDTHPSVADRVRRARQAGEPGVFQTEIPARKLFAAFEVVSKQVTQLHYTDDLGISYDVSMLKPVRSLARASQSS